MYIERNFFAFVSTWDIIYFISVAESSTYFLFFIEN